VNLEDELAQVAAEDAALHAAGLFHEPDILAGLVEDDGMAHVELAFPIAAGPSIEDDVLVIRFSYLPIDDDPPPDFLLGIPVGDMTDEGCAMVVALLRASANRIETMAAKR